MCLQTYETLSTFIQCIYSNDYWIYLFNYQRTKKEFILWDVFVYVYFFVSASVCFSITSLKWMDRCYFCSFVCGILQFLQSMYVDSFEIDQWPKIIKKIFRSFLHTIVCVLPIVWDIDKSPVTMFVDDALQNSWTKVSNYFCISRICIDYTVYFILLHCFFIIQHSK